MAVRDLQSNKVFLRSPDEGLLTMYELQIDAPNSYAVKTENWNFVAVVVPKKDTLQVNGASISGHMLQKLQEDLRSGRLSVNREGLCYLGREGITHALLDLEYYRLNDLFSWSDYVNDQDNQVNQAVETAWNRCDMRKGDVLVDYKEKENELQELMQSVKGEDELNKLKEEVKMLRQQHSSTSAELESRKKEIEKKADELKKMEEERGTLRQQLCSTEADLQTRREDLRKKELELKKVEAECNALQQKLSAVEVELQSRKEDLEKKNKELLFEQVRSTEAKLMEKEIEKREEELIQVEEDSNTLRRQFWSYRAELNLRKHQLQKKDQEFKKVQEKAKSLLQTLSCNETELQVGKEELERMKEELQTMKEESDTLLQQLSSANADLKFTKGELEKKKEEVTKVKEESSALREQLYTIEAELNVRKKELEMKGEELKEVQDHISSTPAKLQSCIEERENKEKELIDVKQKLSSTEAKLKSSKEDQEKKEKELKKLKDEVSSAKTKIEELESELERNGLSENDRTNVDSLIDIVVSRRLPLSPRSFKCFKADFRKKAFEFPPKGANPQVFTPLDSDKHAIGFTIKQPRFISDGKWDKNNWWVITVTGNAGNTHALAYYGGKFDTAEAYGIFVNIPFHKTSTFKTNGDDQVGMVRGIGLRFLLTFEP